MAQFPNLAAGSFTQTSPFDPLYNCVAWALERDTAQWWQPGGPAPYYWPLVNAPRSDALTVYFEGFEAVGFRRCRYSRHLPGWQLIAIYSDQASGTFLHVASHLRSNLWSSKLGKNIDISHASLVALEDGLYGKVTHFMRRIDPGAQGLKRLLALALGLVLR